MPLYRIGKRKVIGLSKMHHKCASCTEVDLKMLRAGYKYRLRDLQKWDAIAYFKTLEAGLEYVHSKGWQEW